MDNTQLSFSYRATLEYILVCLNMLETWDTYKKIKQNWHNRSKDRAYKLKVVSTCFANRFIEMYAILVGKVQFDTPIQQFDDVPPGHVSAWDDSDEKVRSISWVAAISLCLYLD